MPSSWRERLGAGAVCRADLLLGLVGCAAGLWLTFAARHVPSLVGSSYDTRVYLAEGERWSRLELLRRVVDPNHSASGAPWYFPPGYPVFLGPILAARRALGGIAPVRVWIGVVQSVLLGVTVTLTASIARCTARAEVAGMVGIVAGLTLALWPGQVLSAATIMSEPLAVTVFVGVLAILVRPRPRLRWLAVAGVLAGACVVVRYRAAPMLLVAPFVAASTRRTLGWGQRWHAALALAGGAAVVLVPWVALHRATHDGFLPRTSSVVNLCEGNHASGSGHFAPVPGSMCDTHLHSESEIARTTERWMLRHPGRQFGLVWVRARDTFGNGDSYAFEAYPAPDAPRVPPLPEQPARSFADAWWAVAAAVALVGFGIGFVRAAPGFRRLAVLNVAMVAGPLATVGNARYHAVVVPFLAVCVGQVVAALAARGWRPSGVRLSRSRALAP